MQRHSERDAFFVDKIDTLCYNVYALINDVYTEKILQDIFRHFTQKQVTKIFTNLF